MKRLLLYGVLFFWSTTNTFADFSYEQTSRVTGGMMAGAVKFASVFSRKAQEPVRTQVAVKGSRMAHAGTDHVQVIDLGNETITDIDLQKRTYSVITFAEMSQALAQMAEKAGKNKDAEKVDMSFKASVERTGQSKEIAGLKASEVILTLEMEGTDKESGGKGSMRVKSDMWLAPNVAGYEEVREFYQRMATKISWAPASGTFAQGQSEMSKAFADLNKESAKLDGVPLLQVVNIGISGEGQPAPAASQQKEPEKPSITGAIGKLGGFGGFGRKKKQKPEEEQPAAQSAPSAGAGTLMEMTVESSGFSAAPVDASRFELPAGFRKVDSELLRGLRK